MNNETLKKIRKAESLRKDVKFPLSLFKEPDYLESGELFSEAALECSEMEDKVKYYTEAANTFLRSKAEYNQYRASECYKKLFEILKEKDLATAVGFYIQHSECLERIGKNMMAGQSFQKIGELLRRVEPRRSIEMLLRARKCYEKDQNCPYHHKEAVMKCLEVQLETKDYVNAIESLDGLKIEHSSLCKQILMYLVGRSDFEDVLERNESELMTTLLNKDKESGMKALREFKEQNSLPEIVNRIFEVAIEEMRPENDIC